MFEEEKQITVEILEQVVAKDFSCNVPDVTIINYECSAGSNKGDNFTCVVIAVKVKAKVGDKLHEELSYMVKVMPNNEYRASWLNESRGFHRECVAYGKLIPEMEAMRRELGVQAGLGMPVCYLADAEKKVIVMENLKAKGYSMLKMEELSLVQIQSILKELARYHATSYHYLQLENADSSFVKKYPDFALEGWMNDSSEECRVESELLFEPLIPTLIEMIETCGSDDDRNALVSKLEKFVPVRRDRVREVFRPKGKFDVLIHNDLWSNNMLFKGDEVKFVDLQFVKVSRPTIDLNYFFCSSTTSHFREEHFNDLLKIYHDVLIAELKGLGYSDDVYTMSQLVEDYNDCFAFGLIVGMFHGQIKLVPFDGSMETFDIENSVSDEAQQKMMIQMRKVFIDRAKSAPKFVENLVQLVFEAVNRGVI